MATTRWFVQPLNEKAKNAANEFDEQCPEKYAALTYVQYPDSVHEVRGVWEVTYAFMEKMHRDKEIRFQAFFQKDNQMKRPWNFPFDKKKKLARKVKAAVAKVKKPKTGNAIKI